MWLIYVKLSQRKSVKALPSHLITLPELIEWINNDLKAIPYHICNGAIQNLREHLQQNVDADSRHLGTLFFKHDEYKIVCTD